MRKTKILTLALLPLAMGILAGCGEAGPDDPTPQPQHEHTFATEWTHDENKHWHVATCEHTDVKGNEADHDYGDDNKCDVCGYEKQVVPPTPHTHDFSGDFQSDENNHWKECSCGEKDGVAAHADNNGDNKCDLCGYDLPVVPPTPHTHDFSGDYMMDANNHWKQCSCGEKDGLGAHIDSNLDEKCDVCGYAMPDPAPHVHTFASTWSSDASTHWHAATCEHTDLKNSVGAHADGNGDGKCDVCGYNLPNPEPHVHTYALTWSNDEYCHWHAATCGHDVKSEEGAHVDANKDGKCDVCVYQMETPVVDPHKVDQTGWNAAFGAKEHIFMFAENYKATLVISGAMSGETLFKVDNNKLETNQNGMTTYFSLEDGVPYIYALDHAKWTKDQLATVGQLTEHVSVYFEPFGDFSAFSYDEVSETYKAASVFDGAAINLVVSFTDGKVMSASYDATDPSVPSMTAHLEASFVYGGQTVTLPEVEPAHEHVFDILCSDQYNHWFECECGEVDQTFIEAHYDIEPEDGFCDVCGCEMGESPIPELPMYSLLVGGESLSMVYNSDLEQYEYCNLDVVADEEITVMNVTPGAEAILTSLSIGDDAHGFTVKEGVLKASADGNYSFYLKPSYGSDTIYIAENTSPVPGEPVYAYKVNDGEYVTLAHNDEQLEYEEFYVQNLDLVDGDKITIANIVNPEMPAVFQDLTVEGATDVFEFADNALNCKADGAYDFYLKPSMEGNKVYIAAVVPPTPGEPVYAYKVNDGEYVTLAHNDEQLEYEEFYVQNLDLVDGDKITIANIVNPEMPAVFQDLTVEGATDVFEFVDNALNCKADGTYDFYLKPSTEGNKVYIAAVVPPTPGEAVYGYKVNDGKYEEMIFEEKNGQWEVYDVEVSKDDKITFANICGTLEEPAILTSLHCDGETQGFEISNGVLTAGKDGIFTFIISPEYENDRITIFDNSSPIPESDCKLMGSFDGWTDGIEMVLKKDSETEYFVENVGVKAGDAIKVKNGPGTEDYCQLWKQEGEGSAFAAGVCSVDGEGNAKFLVDAVINVYYESALEGGNGYGAYISLKNVISPYKGEAFDGASLGKLSFVFNKVEGDIIEYKLLNAPAGEGMSYEILKNDVGCTLKAIEGPEKDNFNNPAGRITYSGSATELNFYLKVSISTGDLTLYVENPNAPAPTTCTVTFTINYGTENGQGVYIVGDFCGWDPTKGIRGTWTEGNNWVFEITVDVNTVWSFKFVINNYDEPTKPAIRWEADPNRSYTFEADGSETFNWQA